MSSYPTRRNLRLRGYDYAQPGSYFVTLRTANRRPLLGHIVDGRMIPSQTGALVEETFRGIPNHFAGVEIDSFVLMPTHLHAIIVLRDVPNVLPLPELLRRFKTYAANQCRKRFKISTQLWQRNFYERVIRNERELDAARKYIANNVQQWELDRENPERGWGADSPPE